jgi:hypothetical protein
MFYVTERYFIVKIGRKYWYWDKTGHFDGVSWDID